MARKRYVRGDRAFRRLMKKMADETVRAEMVETLEQGGAAILAAQRADATVSRRVRSTLTKRVLSRSLRLRVGIVGRPANRRLWWARVIEKGRKAQTVIASRAGAHRGIGGRQIGRRERALAGGTRGVYRMRVSALAAKPAIYSARVLAIRETMGGKLRDFWTRVLTKASQGISDA